MAPLLPPHRGGRPRKDDRAVINVILRQLATGAPWRDVLDRHGRRRRLYTRFRRWAQAGVWGHLPAEVQRQAGAARQIAW